MTEAGNAVIFDFAFWTLLLILALAIVGFKRGVRAEGITLAGVLATAVVFTNEPLRERIVGMINKMPRAVDLLLGPEDTALALGVKGSRLLATADQKLIFYIVFFIAGLVLFYIAGSVLGGPASSGIERLSGGILGGLSGFVSSLAMTNFSQSYLALHPNMGQLRLDLPSFLTPSLPSTNVLAQYTPLVFLGAFFLIGALAFTSIIRTRR